MICINGYYTLNRKEKWKIDFLVHTLAVCHGFQGVTYQITRLEN